MLDFRDLPDFLKKQRSALRRFAGSMSSLLVAFAAQALSFIVLAHYLGTVWFGLLMVITSVTTLAAAWCGFGFNELLRRHVGRDRSAFSGALGHSLIMISATGTVLTIMFIVGLTMYLPLTPNAMDNFQILLLLGVSNIVLTPIVGLTESLFLSIDDFTRANIVNGSLGVGRALTAVIACVGFGVGDLQHWAYWYAGAHVVLCLVCAAMIRRVGTPRWRVMRDELALGISFSLSNFLFMLRSNLDILVLTATATPHFIGVYGVARRIVAVGVVVPGAFDRQIYGRLAIAGASGPIATMRLAKRYLAYSVILSTTTSAFIFVVAGVVPWLVGPDYAEAVGVARILCWTLISTAVQFLAFDSLNAAELHRISTITSGATNIAGAVLVVWLGSAYGIAGIIVSLYLSDIVRGAALWAVLQFMSQRQSALKSPVRDGAR